MQHDVMIVGGSYAGMAAALQLLRARRTVLVVDAGMPRNRFASHAHGFLAQDGVPPTQIASTARKQLEVYPTLTWVDGMVTRASGQTDGFTVATAAGTAFEGRRLLFATGVQDQLPPVPGLAERWGKAVFHCPYCHGFELNMGPIGVVASSANSVHQAELLPEWGTVTLLTNGVLALDAETRARLSARGVAIEEAVIERIDGHADVLVGDGRRLSFAGLFAAPLCAPATPVAEAMGCALEETPMGTQVQTAGTKETTIPGVFACGDLAHSPHSISLAVADGAWAGAQLHRSLVWPES